MSIAIRFYQFNKKENSTARPSSSGGTSYNCVLKDNCSIETPEIELNVKPSDWYNYAYIADFDRYYHVTNWEYFRGVWTATLNVDVLASYKTAIGNASQYVLRSSHTYDKEIKDTLYPLKSTSHKLVQSGTVPSWAVNFGGGTYVCYINNGDPDGGGFGSLGYMTFTPTQFSQLLAALYPDAQNSWSGTFFTQAYNVVAGALLNPIDFITKVVWIPISLTAGNLPTKFGNYYAAYEDPDDGTQNVRHNTLESFRRTLGPVNITVPKRPDTIRGAWANTEPFGKYYLYWAPFGIIPLNSNMLIGAQSIDIVPTLDLTTGDLKVTIYTIGDYGSVKDRIYSGTSRVGIEIPVDKAKTEFRESFDNILGIASSAVDAMTGNYAGLANDITGTIGSMGEAPMKSGGSTTGLLALEDTIYLYYEYFDFADEDNANRGRPLCQVTQLSTIPGFIVCSEGDITISGTANEQTQIKQFLERGFYYE